MRFRLAPYAAAVFALSSLVAGGQSPNGSSLLPDRKPVPSAPAVSSSRRFVVSGMRSADNVALAAAADRVAEGVEVRIGAAIPFARHEVIRLTVLTNAPVAGPRIVRAQGWADRQIVQRLSITEPAEVDQEDLLEALCWLLLNRKVIRAQRVEAREERAGEVPDWLAVGLAQNLYASLRARNAQILVDAWRKGGGLSFEEVLELEYLPDGRWGEKAAAGMAVDWLVARGDAPSIFARMFEQLAAGRRLDMIFLSRPDVLNLSPREIEKRWDLWIAQQSKVKREWGLVSAEKLEALDRLLVATPRTMGFAEAEDMPAVLPVADMPDYRDAEWLPTVVTALSLKIKGLGIGESEEFRQVLEGYGDYLESLARHARGTEFQRFFGRVPSEREVRSLLIMAQNRYEGFLEGSRGAGVEVMPEREAGRESLDTYDPMSRFMTREERVRLPMKRTIRRLRD